MSQLTETSQLEQMIQQQVIDRGITNHRLINALRSIPRERFFSDAAKTHAFSDRASPIGLGQTISQPFIVALMTERLEIEPHHKILEIGTGSGYQTAILARLAADVCTIERLKPLLDAAWERLMELGLRNVHYRYGDGTLGWPERKPFDRILITAGAPEVPRKLLLDQLVDGGIAVLPVGPEEQQMLVTIHRRDDQLESTEITPCRFVKLIGQGGWAEDEK